MYTRSTLALLTIAVAGTLLGAAGPGTRPPARDPIINAATEQKLVTSKLADGGIPPLVGVQNIQVFRATRGAPELADGRGWTYNHHMDLAQWKGRMYLAWTNGERDEDTWPAREMYITSEDGFHWTKPAELFPQGVSTSLRMYFFKAPNGHMLTLAGLRTDTQKLSEANKGGAVVREILPNHTLGPAYILIDGPAAPLVPTPKFDTAPDQPFIQACRQLLADHTFLEQQDFGKLLGANRMAVYEKADGNFGRALCFFHRPDGALVGIGKRAWTVVSTDEGKTWSTPVHPESIITGNAREWVQKTSDGKYAFIYNPHASDRLPLVALISTDGITFSTMRTVHGEVPLQRYEGLNRSVGPQYTRGISEWASDGTTLRGPASKDMWIVYSSSKEDIWVSRIPVPLKAQETAPVHDDFAAMPLGPFVPNWNTYAPLWGGVSVAQAPDQTPALKLEDRDPYDYAKAERVFPEKAAITARMKILVAAAGHLEWELHSDFGSARPVRLVIANGKIMAGSQNAGAYSPDHWFTLSVSLANGKLSLAVNDQVTPGVPLAEPAEKVARLTLRTGAFRGINEGTRPAPETDKPVDANVVYIKDVVVE